MRHARGAGTRAGVGGSGATSTGLACCALVPISSAAWRTSRNCASSMRASVKRRFGRAMNIQRVTINTAQ
jgi:hypothetical protein